MPGFWDKKPGGGPRGRRRESGGKRYVGKRLVGVLIKAEKEACSVLTSEVGFMERKKRCANAKVPSDNEWVGNPT